MIYTRTCRKCSVQYDVKQAGTDNSGLCAICYHDCQRKREYEREKYHNDPVYRENQLIRARARLKKKYDEDPQYRRRKIKYNTKYNRDRYKDPKHHAKMKEANRLRQFRYRARKKHEQLGEITE